MQPASSKQVASSSEEHPILQLLHLHASKFLQQLACASSAAEECEREAEHENEVEREAQRELERVRSVARLESNWLSWEAALCSSTKDKFVNEAANTEVPGNFLSNSLLAYHVSTSLGIQTLHKLNALYQHNEPTTPTDM